VILMSERKFTRDVLPWVGDLHQLAGVDLVEAIDGPERGVRKAMVRSGSGLEFTVNIDRGFDIGDARLNGVPMTWRSPAGAAHPYAFQDDSQGWLRRFPGGLLTTCGFDNAGPASGGRTFHGRASQTPAKLLVNQATWHNDSCTLELVGQYQDYRLFSDYLVITRTIRVECGTNKIRVQDSVENCGNRPSAVMVFYHCNFGYPLLCDTTKLLVESTVTPIDDSAAEGIHSYAMMHAPKRGQKEQVFLHDITANANDEIAVHLVNEQLSAAVTLRYSKMQLPYFLQWKNLSEGAYVLGLEPCTCGPLGYQGEKEAGRVRWLEPGESQTLALDILFTSNPEDIAHLMDNSAVSTSESQEVTK
jgi:hypothetical protein